MRVEEQRLIFALSGCRYLPAAREKRIIRELGPTAEAADLTKRQRAFLWRIGHRYGCQLPAEINELVASAPCAAIPAYGGDGAAEDIRDHNHVNRQGGASTLLGRVVRREGNE